MLGQAASVFSRSPRTVSLGEAVKVGDLDAVRFHLHVQGDPVMLALHLAVRHCKPTLLKFLLRRCMERPRDGLGPNWNAVLLLEALIAIMRANGTGALVVFEAVVQTGVDLNAVIWPNLPAIGSAPLVPPRQLPAEDPGSQCGCNLKVKEAVIQAERDTNLLRSGLLCALPFFAPRADPTFVGCLCSH